MRLYPLLVCTARIGFNEPINYLTEMHGITTFMVGNSLFYNMINICLLSLY